MTTVIKKGKELHKVNTFDIFKRINNISNYHYYPYNYHFDSDKDIDILKDNNKHYVVYYYYKMNNIFNYDLVESNIDIYFENLINNNVKLNIFNGKIIIKTNNNDNDKKLEFDNNEFFGVKHSLQLGYVFNNIFNVDNINNNLLLNVNELENSLINGVMNDFLINNNFNNELFTNILTLYRDNNNNFDLIKEYYGYSFIFNTINCDNVNPFYNNNILLCINLNGEMYFNFINIDNNNEITIKTNIFKDNITSGTYKDYFIIKYNELIFNKYTDLKNINYN